MTDIYKWLYGKRGKAGVTQPMEPLPDELLPFRDAIDATVKPFIAGAVLDGPPSSATGSQLGGMPWWPRGLDYPQDRTGTPLFLLAQINLGETELLAPLPARGLLQVFIAADELYGIDFEQPKHQQGFRVVFHDDLERQPVVIAFPADVLARAKTYLPLQDPARARAIALNRDAMAVDIRDYRFAALLPDIAADDDLSELYAEWHTAAAIRLGGYASFTQDDPRADQADLGDFNLLTVDTTDGIMWGDSGIGQFLMHDADLRERNFKRVAYNWDCC